MYVNTFIYIQYIYIYTYIPSFYLHIYTIYIHIHIYTYIHILYIFIYLHIINKYFFFSCLWGCSMFVCYSKNFFESWYVPVAYFSWSWWNLCRISQLSAKYLIRWIISSALVNANLGHSTLIYLVLANVPCKFS